MVNCKCKDVLAPAIHHSQLTIFHSQFFLWLPVEDLPWARIGWASRDSNEQRNRGLPDGPQD
jgi:hypothetical protein